MGRLFQGSQEELMEAGSWGEEQSRRTTRPWDRLEVGLEEGAMSGLTLRFWLIDGRVGVEQGLQEEGLCGRRGDPICSSLLPSTEQRKESSLTSPAANEPWHWDQTKIRHASATKCLSLGGRAKTPETEMGFFLGDNLAAAQAPTGHDPFPKLVLIHPHCSSPHSSPSGDIHPPHPNSQAKPRVFASAY